MTPEEHQHTHAEHHHVVSKQQENTKILVIVLLILNVLLGIYIAFFKHDAVRLETLKAWGDENMAMATQLYKSPVYIQQQKSTLDQILTSMNKPSGTTQPSDTTQQVQVQPQAQPTPTK